ncbi:hypothetical protein C8Q75DRAFT_220699 [Abortiporus biennis]|nr:hypothetical protein C8Q75DRAFT_220699 [Abortiporus biennis]
MIVPALGKRRRRYSCLGSTYLDNSLVRLILMSIPKSIHHLTIFLLVFRPIRLACNDNPSSQNVLCRAKTHFISSIVFAWLWLGAGTINSMVCPTACNFVDNPNLDHGRCGPEVTEAVVAFLMCAINVFLSVYIPRVAKRHEATGLNTNIALGGTSTESQARVWVQRSSTPVTLRATKSASLADDDDASTIVGHETNDASESDVKLKELV